MRLKNFSLIFVVALVLFAGCSKREKKPENMEFEELRDKATSLVERNRKNQAIVCLEQLIAQYPENQDIFEYKFILADLYLKVGRLEEAYELYKHYTEFYPSEDRAEEAHYKSVLSKFYQTLKISKDCDDTDARNTVKRCEAYLKNDRFGQYKNDVRDIKYTCERRLIDKEIYVFDTYLRRKKFQSAQKRIDYLRTTFLEKHPALEAQILFLEGKLANKQKNGNLAEQKLEELFNKYPESRFTKMAYSMIAGKKKLFDALG